MLHTSVASGMVVAYGVLVIRLHAWIPGMPKAFIALGWLFLAIVLVLAVLFAVGSTRSPRSNSSRASSR